MSAATAPAAFVTHVRSFVGPNVVANLARLAATASLVDSSHRFRAVLCHDPSFEAEASRDRFRVDLSDTHGLSGSDLDCVHLLSAGDAATAADRVLDGPGGDDDDRPLHHVVAYVSNTTYPAVRLPLDEASDDPVGFFSSCATV